MRKATELFLTSDEEEEDMGMEANKYAKQVINLGSGYDTSWWCLVGNNE